MSWFAGAHPLPAEMRREVQLYLHVAHVAKKHVPRTRVVLRDLWKQSRRRPYIDVWPMLDAMQDVTTRGTITGAAIKSAFRRRLLELQGGRCCYCRRWLVSTAFAKPIEHILPRRRYPQFSIEFWNLAVACSDCNGAKKDHVWGTISTVRRRYPRPREFTDAFHPRFHRYDEHVRYVRLETNATTVALFTGLTPQGRHLCRTLLHRIAAKETLVENNPALAPAMDQIRSFEVKAEGLRLAKFDTFREALEESFLHLIS
ncbi:TIGR02646 family protein [Aromatoleum tolulyticum]|uniref:TIGR02646 family protein n=1 Tax=Aromatoleum tolulyticum TaxID=34027 RepID=A0A1N6Y1S2_9RHOO|nr:hypothetical protein [Aromatoleum tolulyticum]SIR08497.1 TIGR02646 family protein [Aromatoleum tolulyticum]